MSPEPGEESNGHSNGADRPPKMPALPRQNTMVWLLLAGVALLLLILFKQPPASEVWKRIINQILKEYRVSLLKDISYQPDTIFSSGESSAFGGEAPIKPVLDARR